MKTIFIEARAKKAVILPETAIRQLPKKIALTATVQFLDSVETIKKQLEDRGIEVSLLKAAKAVYDAQTLGCISVEKLGKIWSNKADAILYIGDGSFHPTGLALAFQGQGSGSKDVFVYNPGTDGFSKLDKGIVERITKQKEIALKRFYASDRIGIIVSTKPGQTAVQSRNISNIRKTLEKRYPGKEFYIFVSDMINLSDFGNFPFIQCWVNTACPMIAYEYYSEHPSKAADERSIAMINSDDIE